MTAEGPPLPPIPREASIVVIGAGHRRGVRWPTTSSSAVGAMSSSSTRARIPMTGGSTSHAPGGVFATNYSRAMTRLALETVDLLASLEVDGAPCFYPVGHDRARPDARTLGGPPAQARCRPELGRARCPAHLDPEETRELVPLARPVAVPRRVPRPDRRDRQAVPRRRGAAPRGGRRRRVPPLVPETRVTGFDVRRRASSTASRPIAGTIATPLVVVCGGIWGPLLGEMLRHADPAHPVRAPVHDHDARRVAGRRDARGRPPDDPRPGPRDVLPPARRPVRRRLVPARAAARRPARHPPTRRAAAGAACPAVNPHGEAHDMPSLRPWTPEHFEAGWADARRLMPELARDPARLHAQRDVLVHARRLPGHRAESTAVRGRLGRRGGLAHPRRRRRSGDGRLDHRWRARLRRPRDGHRPIRARPDVARVRARPRRPQLRRGLRPGPSAPAARRRSAAADRAVPRAARGAGRRVLRGQGLGARPVVRDESPAIPAAARTGWAGAVLVDGGRDRASGDPRAGRPVRPDLADQGRRRRSGCRGVPAAARDQRPVAGRSGRSCTRRCAIRRAAIRSDITFTRLAEDRYQLGCNGPQDVAYLRRARRDDERVEIVEITAGHAARSASGARSARALRPVDSRRTTCRTRRSRT